jgi:hypothetical protein
MEIDWAAVENLHTVEGFAPGTCGNQKSTTPAI